MSLSTLRAADRLLYTLAEEPGRDDGLVDSMVLLHPAMRACEMWRPLDVKQGKKPRSRNETLKAINRIAIVHSGRDRADGWVFCTSQTLLSNSAVQFWDSWQRELVREAGDVVPPLAPKSFRSFGEWLVAFPFDAYIFASSHAAAIVHTGVETAYALTVGGVKTLAAGKGYRPDFYKYSMGNQGMNALRATWHKFDERALHADRCGFRGLSTSMAPEYLKSSVVRRGNVYVFDATEIYNRWGLFVGAHNDHRSLKEASKDDRFMRLRKVGRTCRFAHNFTHATPSAP